MVGAHSSRRKGRRNHDDFDPFIDSRRAAVGYSPALSSRLWSCVAVEFFFVACGVDPPAPGGAPPDAPETHAAPGGGGSSPVAPVTADPPAEVHVVFPDDGGVLNVRDFGARGDGATDDTAALRAALAAALDSDQRYVRPFMLYFPEGTYLITAPLEAKHADTELWSGWRSGLIVRGERESKTIIKLADGAIGFDDPDAPQAMLTTGSENPKAEHGGGNQAFRHSLFDLTFDTGAQNPGAIGLDWMANNRSAVERVTIRSGDPEGRGVAGVSMKRYATGPCLFEDVRIEGFDHAFVVRNPEYSQTYEHIELVGQRKGGFDVERNAVTVRGLHFEGVGPVFRGVGAHVVLLDADLTSTSGETVSVYERNGGHFAFARVEASGFGALVEGADGEVEIAALDAAETALDSVGGAARPPPQLDIEETPIDYPDDLREWVSAVDFGATPNDASDDDGPALAQALASGAPVVYLPRGSYHIDGTLLIDGERTTKVIGLHASLNNRDEDEGPVMRIRGDDGPALTFEMIRFQAPILHDGNRTVIFRHADLVRYEGTAQSTVFFHDVSSNHRRQGGPGDIFTFGAEQRVFARQLNPEDLRRDIAPGWLMRSEASLLWVLGFKTEGHQTVLEQRGGLSIIWGGLLYPLRPPPGGVPMPPAFLRAGGRLRTSFVVSSYEPGHGYEILVARPDGEPELTRADARNRLRDGAFVPMYDAGESP
ncbi:MAG: glycosyl hydrolase family 28-related protein [Myxococcota bacterium]